MDGRGRERPSRPRLRPGLGLPARRRRRAAWLRRHGQQGTWRFETSPTDNPVELLGGLLRCASSATPARPSAPVRRTVVLLGDRAGRGRGGDPVRLPRLRQHLGGSPGPGARRGAAATWSTGSSAGRLLRGHVVDFLELPHWPVFNLADCGDRRRGSADHAPVLAWHPDRWRSRTAGRGRIRSVTASPEQRTLFVPDGLEGERVDAAIARLFGLSRTRSAEARSRWAGDGRRKAGRQVRPRPRRCDARCHDPASLRRPSRSTRRSSKASGSCTRMTRSS